MGATAVPVLRLPWLALPEPSTGLVVGTVTHHVLPWGLQVLVLRHRLPVAAAEDAVRLLLLLRLVRREDASDQGDLVDGVTDDGDVREMNGATAPATAPMAVPMPGAQDPAAAPAAAPEAIPAAAPPAAASAPTVIAVRAAVAAAALATALPAACLTTVLPMSAPSAAPWPALIAPWTKGATRP